MHTRPTGFFLLTLVAVLTATGVADQDAGLSLNEREYFERTGLNVFVFSNEYNGFFFDEKTAGVEIIHHGNLMN